MMMIDSSNADIENLISLIILGFSEMIIRKEKVVKGQTIKEKCQLRSAKQAVTRVRDGFLVSFVISESHRCFFRFSRHEM
jgi:hypothetical protein